jgi:SAM-dependent methyltransferase
MDNLLEKRLLTMSKSLSRKGLYEFLSAEFSKIQAGADVLNVGAGGEVNELLQAASRRIGFKVISLYIDKERYPDLIGDICNYDFGAMQFDVVVISEVLEHLHSPHSGLKNIHANLKADGLLILSTPFILPMHDRPHDYFRFTRHGLELLLKDFRDVQIKERNSYFETIDVLWVRLLQTNLPTARRACWLIIPIIYFLKTPISCLLGKLIQTDAMTTGYVVTANK